VDAEVDLNNEDVVAAVDQFVAARHSFVAIRAIHGSQRKYATIILAAPGRF
jgi:hypothetical protein